jgi:hypothetical protein
MPSLEMQGPYKLTASEIDKNVNRTSPGNYALGRKDDGGTFRVGYVGRSDSDVAGRLKSWIKETERPLFKFSYATSPKAAFEEECRNYHDYNPPDNGCHPDRPNGSNWKCPYCNKFK